MKKEVNGICALCLFEKRLCDSHIIPKFQWKLMYEDRSKPELIKMSLDPTEPEDKSFDEGQENLLCSQCEIHISQWEDHAARVIRKLTSEDLSDKSCKGVTLDLDYPKFKLFILSLFWRMGVAKGQRFSGVKLGPHAETMRQMLIDSIPGESSQYCSFLLIPRSQGKWMKEFMHSPIPFRYESHRAYSIIIHGVQFILFMSSHAPPAGIESYGLTEKGLRVHVTNDPKFLSDIAARCVAASEKRIELGVKRED